MSTIWNLVASALLVTNIYANNTWGNNKNIDIQTIENIINKNYKKDVNKCIDFNRGVIVLIISDDLSSGITANELLNRELNNKYIKQISNMVNTIIPDMRIDCQIKVLENYWFKYRVINK